MPLIQSCSEEAQATNIAKLTKEGYSQEQAVAIVADMCNGKEKVYYLGSTIKSLNNARIGGYLIVWGDTDNLDLQGEYFSPDTRVNLDWYKERPALYHHGLDDTLKSMRVGTIDVLKQDDVGIWAEAQLDLHNEYIEAIKRLVDRGILSWSSGSLPHLVEVSKSGHIKQWPIVEGSLTPTPAMPYGTEIFSVKAFLELIGEAEQLDKSTENEKSEIEAEIQCKCQDTPGGKKHMGNAKKQAEIGERIMALVEELSKELAAIFVQEVATEAEVEMSESETESVVEEVAASIEEVVMDAGIIEEAEEMQAEAEDELDEEELAGKMMAIIKANLDRITPKALREPIRKQEERRARAKSWGRELANGVRDATHISGKKRMGGFQAGVPTLIHKSKDARLATFIKCAYNRDFSDYYGKAQNPYIGERGGYLLGQELSNEILPELRAEVVMFGAGVKQTTVAQGLGSITVPKMTTSPTAYRPGINEAISSADADFDQITAFLRPIAAISTIPFQLIQQSPLQIEQTIREELIKSIALQIDIEILEGVAAVSGSNTGAQIKGVRTVLEQDATLKTTNVVTLGTGNGRQPKFSDLVDAETQVANGNVPDRMPKAWVMNARSRGRFRGLESSTGEPLLRENFGNEPYPRLMGYPLWVGNQITNDSTTGTNTDTTEIYFGAWEMSQYFMQNQIEVIVDNVTKADQLQMRIIAYAYSDFIVHYPEAFYIMKGVR